ncbi:MAG: amidohydrolase [bacterium]
MNGERLLVTGARIWTAGQPWESPLGDLLIDSGVVEAVEPAGTLDEGSFSGIRRIKLPGGVILPSFFDAHLHLDLGGVFLSRIALRDCTSPSEVLTRLAHEREPGEGWMIAIGLPEGAWPSYEELHRATKGRPAILFTRDYHSAFVNPEGMVELGLTADTPPPPGGMFDKDDSGQLTGLLRENAVRWAENRLPAPTDRQRQDNLLLAANNLTEWGVLGASDASDNSSWDALRILDRENRMPLRIEHWHRCLELDETCLEIERVDLPRLKRLRIKTFSDGALGSRTAWMLDDYADTPGVRGGPVPELKTYHQFLQRAVEKGWSHTAHAIGDAAVRWVGEVLSQFPVPGLPHRIEHVQHIDVRGIAQLTNSSVLASIQPTHRLDDSGMLVPRLGAERAEFSYPQRSLLRNGSGVIMGTDWPVVSADPRRTIFAAMSQRKPGEGMPGEELSLEQTLTAMTCHPAEAAGFHRVGRLSHGYAADFIWLPDDPGRDPSYWREMKTGGVWAGGHLLHANHGALTYSLPKRTETRVDKEKT